MSNYEDNYIRRNGWILDCKIKWVEYKPVYVTCDSCGGKGFHAHAGFGNLDYDGDDSCKKCNRAGKIYVKPEHSMPSRLPEDLSDRLHEVFEEIGKTYSKVDTMNTEDKATAIAKEDRVFTKLFAGNAMNDLIDSVAELKEIELKVRKALDALPKEYFELERDRAEAYKVYMLGRSENPYEITLEKILEEVEAKYHEEF